jgi:hypothetical protein
MEIKDAEIAVVGLGYVGLPLLLEFNKAGMPVPPPMATILGPWPRRL